MYILVFHSFQQINVDSLKMQEQSKISATLSPVEVPDILTHAAVIFNISKLVFTQ